MDTQERSTSGTFTTPVLVVGAGPVGCVLALELAAHGIPSILLERSLTPSRHPKMDYVNGRSMELLRRLDLSGDLRAGGVSPEHSFNFIWASSFNEPPITVWPYASVDEARQRIAETNDGSMPTEPYQRVQGSQLEEILRRSARTNPYVDMRQGWSFEHVDQGADGVVATVVDTTTDTEHTIRSRYIVACDGANSTVRQSVGIGVDLAGPPTQHCDVYFKSRDPVLRKHGRAFLQILAGGLTLVSRDEDDTWTGTFLLMDEASASSDPVALMFERAGVAFEIDELLNVTRWEGMLAVASSYRRGSAFVAGDAAHQFYPTGGHGANTGVADAVDLGWKLAATLRGWGGPGLLDSYEAERRPVAQFNREMCANLLEVWRRFAVLLADGASHEHVAGFLDQEAYQLDNVGIHFGYRYDASPIVWHSEGPAPRWEWHRITPTTWPGGRAPSLFLPDGTALFDHFGRELTLVDCSGTGAGEALVSEAAQRGIPLSHLPIDDPGVRKAWEYDLVLVRPDHHVAWRGNGVPDGCGAVLDRVRGF